MSTSHRPAPPAFSEEVPDRDRADPLCPLCDYNLRGLTEPRCPECGHRFDWPSLLDPDLRIHPYLFEHHPRRNIRSFVRTFLGGLRPSRFWATLRPTQPSHLGRLLAYWFIANLMLPVALAAMVVSTALAYVPDQVRLRTAALSEYRFLTSAEGRQRFPNAFRPGRPDRGPAAYVDAAYPPPLSRAFFDQVRRERFDRLLPNAVATVVIYLLWPWLSFAVMMIFLVSMERAKVKEEHVLRCVLYGCDAGLWVGLLVAIIVPPMDAWLRRELPLPERFLLATSVVFAVFTAYRLAAAYRLYLRFDHPAATAIASQIVVLLGVMVVIVGLARAGVL